MLRRIGPKEKGDDRILAGREFIANFLSQTEYQKSPVICYSLSFKKTDPQQSLFGLEPQLSESLRSRIIGSWAELFREQMLPILLESEYDFSQLHGKTGRPNFRKLGLSTGEQCVDSTHIVSNICARGRIVVFKMGPAVLASEPYKLLVRLFLMSNAKS